MLRLLFSPAKLRIKSVINYDGTLKINIDTSSYVEWELFFRGYYEKWVIDLMRRLIPQSGVVVDAGANIGTHTLIMTKLVGSSGRVLAFDPDAKSANRLTENVNLNNFTNTKIFRSGLSDKEGAMTLFSYSDEMLDQGTASLYELPKLEKTERQVEINTLDKVLNSENINRLDFVRIDTRGSDFHIILGAKQSIEKFRPYVVFEYNRDNWANSGSSFEEAKDFFNNQNYALYGIDRHGVHAINKETDGKTSYNILACPKEKPLKT